MGKRAMALFAVWVLVLGLCGCGPSGTAAGGGSAELTYQDYYNLGIRYLSEGNYQEAIIAFTAAIEIDPKQAPAYVGRGDAYVLSGETEENLEAAKADYEKALELDETNEDAYLRLADVYVLQGDTEAVLEVLRQGLEKNERSQKISEKIAEIGGNDDVSATEPKKTSVKDFLDLVDNDIQQGDYDHALDTLKRLQENDDGNPNKMKSLDEAISIIEQAITSNQRIICPREDWYWNDWSEALKSNTYIVLKDGDCKWSLDSMVGLENVTIQGTGNTRFIIDSPYDMVVMMQRCSNMTLRGLVLGHDPLLTEKGSCAVGVVHIGGNCTDILIEDCDIFGCGTVGIEIFPGATVTVRNSIIRDCSKNILDCQGKGMFAGCSFYGNGYKDPYDYAIQTAGIGTLTFSNCDFSNNMNPVLVDNSNICTFDDCTFSDNAWGNEQPVPELSSEATPTPTQNPDFVIENGMLVKYIGSGGAVAIPSGVTSIENGAFKSCVDVTSVTIPIGVTRIESWAFDGCISLTSVAIPNGVTSIGTSAFGMCTALTSVQIPDSVSSIGDFAFAACTRLSSITIDNSAVSIGKDAFLRRPDWISDDSPPVKNPEADIEKTDIPEVSGNIGKCR